MQLLVASIRHFNKVSNRLAFYCSDLILQSSILLNKVSKMTDKEWEFKAQEFNSRILEIFPNFEFSNYKFFSANRNNANGTYEYRLNQRSLSDTLYSKSLGKEFIHYTSVSNLCNILNEDSIRMYNLKKKNDPKEFDYFFKKHKLQISEEEVNIFKRSFHLFSMCKYDENEKDNFNMWRNYGKDGNGVGIVFELLNENWDYFLFGKTQYEEDELAEQKICQIIQISSEFKEFINQNRIPILFGSLALYHKNKIWCDEKEIRIFTFVGYEEYSLATNFDINEPHHQYLKFYFDGGKIGSYYNLPLENTIKIMAKKAGIENYDFLPRLRIKKVITGYRMTKEDINELQFLIYHHNREYEKTIMFEQSQFFNHFN